MPADASGAAAKVCGVVEVYVLISYIVIVKVGRSPSLTRAQTNALRVSSVEL